MRFDHHLPPIGTSPDRSVWYSAASLIGAVAESFGNDAFIDHTSERRVISVVVKRHFDVLDLVGVAARSVNLTQEIASTTEYAKTQEWARAFYDQYPDLVGIRWRGRQAGSICLLLHDRAQMDHLSLLSDNAISDSCVWPRIARAAGKCHLRVV